MGGRLIHKFNFYTSKYGNPSSFCKVLINFPLKKAMIIFKGWVGDKYRCFTSKQEVSELLEAVMILCQMILRNREMPTLTYK